MHMGHHYQLIAPERITRTAGLSLKPGLAEHPAEERLVSERGPLPLSWSCGPALQLTPLFLGDSNPRWHGAVTFAVALVL